MMNETEKLPSATASPGSHEPLLKLDPYGIPLRPQPRDDPNDPLNWPKWLKLLILVQVSMYAFLALLCASLITPSLSVLAQYFDISLTQAGYTSSIFMLFLGVSANFWNPIANVYGRRLIYLISAAASTALLLASGFSTTFAQMMAYRTIDGIFASVPAGLGSSVVCDLYYEHERGRYLGLYTLLFMCGGHLGPIIGGYIEKDLNWQWCFFLGAIATGTMFIVFLFALSET